METFSKPVMEILTGLSVVVNMNDHKADLDMMTATNITQERKRRGARSDDVVKRHTAIGLGAEIAVTGTSMFKSCNPITEGAKGLSYVQRKQDVECEGYKIEIKTMNAKYGRWYISDAQCESVLRSAILNSFFLLVEYKDLGGLKFEYAPRFLVDSSKIGRYIVSNTGGYSEYVFDHYRAAKAGACIDFKEYSYA